ncbi:TetR/AcrR family transcriptional regulator [Paenibacillus eucommiae]|uniref:TetR/AcrR family hemagglutinin/protease transcriptional regulator n=1 Tax=Paenibacillus eucommiae TaxID=1355755 RepID=A0ABS4J9N0_9BACL|nr:TetR/AcrR family transcriptional regulator [Paenibacillus eucommiae]MBP1996568.1 TetR/AcrR family hemagglutinin/protease transcriptional regulator [Paenibacillus eucommiae]
MSPRNAVKDQKQRMERKVQILDAAMQVIARRGLSATKISDIAATAGLSVGNVYKYFASKDEIFIALVESAQREYRAFVEEAQQKTLPPLQKLYWYTEQWLNNKNGWAHTIILQHARTSETIPEQVKQAVTGRFQDNLGPMAEIIAEGQREGIFMPGDSRELALIYVALMEGLSLHDIPGIQEITAVTPEKAIQMLLVKK